MDETTEEKPWYSDGLAFTCTQCGKCCTGEPGYVWVDDAEVSALAKSQGMKVHEFEAVYTRMAKRGRTLREKPNGDCIFYEAGRGCTVYKIRPRQCRTWPFWESNLETEAEWNRTVEICPGSGEGELIPVEEITRRMKIIKM